MKTAIVTFADSVNYGAALQAAALSHAVTALDEAPVFLTHHNETIAAGDRLFDLKSAKNPLYTAAHLVNFTAAKERQKRFAAFRDRFLRFSDDAPDSFDVVIAGSDQVWNYNLTGDDDFYYLDYQKANSVKTAYAASFGLSAVDPARQARLAALLRDFDFVTVREETAAGIVEKLTGSRPAVALDPTFLLTPADWAAKSADTGKKNEAYIFVYTVFNSEPLWAFAEDLSRRTGLPIKTVSYSKLHRHNADYSFSAGPDEWVELIANASYVVTNSFHGLAFSVNFNRPFFIALPPESAGVGSRLRDLAKRYDLTDREIGVADPAAIPDFAAVNEKLDRDRRESLRLLAEILRTGKSEASK